MSPVTESCKEFLAKLTPEDCYWAGYLRADGTLSCTKGLDNYVIKFGQVHEEPVKAFSDYVGSKTVRTYMNCSGFKKGTTGYYTQTANKAKLYLELGLKSEFLPAELFDSSDFWRGMIDGDGTVALYAAPTIQFVGTYFDVEKLVEFLRKHDIYVSIYPHKNIFRTIFKGNKAKAAAHLIYGSGRSHLTYKRQAAEAIMRLPYSTHHNATKVSKCA